jgi:sorbitol-specific phosphotransferase system component IIC
MASSSSLSIQNGTFGAVLVAQSFLSSFSTLFPTIALPSSRQIYGGIAMGVAALALINILALSSVSTLVHLAAVFSACPD